MVTLERRGDRVDVGAQFFHTDFREQAERLKGVSFSSSVLCGTSMEAAMASAAAAVKRVCAWGGTA
jgi:hypothetical protein